MPRQKSLGRPIRAENTRVTGALPHLTQARLQTHGWFTGVVLALLSFVIPMGGLGMAAVAGLLGLVSLSTYAGHLAQFLAKKAMTGNRGPQNEVKNEVQRAPPQSLAPPEPTTGATTPPRWHMALPPLIAWARSHTVSLIWGLFFVWAAITSHWSPFTKTDYVAKFAISGPAYWAALVALRDMRGVARTRAQLGLLLGGTGAAAVFLAELATGNALTAAYMAPATDMNNVMRSLGRGLSAFVAVLPAIMVLAWQCGRAGIATSLCLTGIAFLGGIGFGLTSNLLGLLAGLTGLAAAQYWSPRQAVRITTGLAALSIVCAPILGLLVFLPDDVRQSLPVTWDHRIEIWAYTVSQLPDNLLWGAGFDASRTVNATTTLRGLALDKMSLHPHSAGLHLYYETGLIGVLMFAAGLIALGRVVARCGDPSLQTAAAGTILACSAMASVSFGVWQEWWVATAFLAAGAVALVGTTPGRIDGSIARQNNTT